MGGLSRLENDRLRHRNDEPPPSSPIFRLLLHDLLLEVPRQNQQIIRLILENPRRRGDRQPHPRYVTPLLVYVPVRHESQHLVPYSRKVEQDGPLGRRPIARDTRAAPPQSLEQRLEITADPLHPGGEVRVVIEAIHPR